jgi:archaellin
MNRILRNPILWSALSVIVSITALVLTQFPPIRQMAKGTDVRISTPQEIYIWHDLGNLGVTFFLDIYNAGGYTINMSKVECAILEKDTGKIFTLPVRTYSTENTDNLSLGTITLNPDQHWTNEVSGFNYFTRSELEQVNDLKTRIRTDVIEKQDKLPGAERSYTWITIDNKLYQEAVDFFNKKFELVNEGNYQFFIKVVSDSGEMLKVQGYDFTLFKGNIQELRRMAERDYKFGAGIIARPRFTREVVTIPITPMNENESKITYQQKIANH